jgi:hypothetical protein
MAKKLSDSSGAIGGDKVGITIILSEHTRQGEKNEKA